jgi:molecular chaperone GrpE
MNDTEDNAAKAPQAEAQPGAESQAAPTTDMLLKEATARLDALVAERDELHDKWIRAEAEMQNLRTRTEREVKDARLYAVQKFARDVVEAAENIRRGIENLPKATEKEPEIVGKLREGFEGVERSFIGLLERNGIVGDEPVGKPFDANLHQAMAEQPSADHPPGTILQAWSRAWTLNGRLLRPAMVVVSKGAPAPAPSAVDTTA